MIGYRPGRVIKELAELNEYRRHLEHHRVHLVAESDSRRWDGREWNKQPVVVTLNGPWKNRDVDKTLAAWGVPTAHRDLDAFVHFRDGGWGVFKLPPFPVVYAFLTKVSKHTDAVTYLELLSRIALHSQYTLSEALTLMLDCVDADPVKHDAPMIRAQSWEYVGRYAVDVLQARMQTPASIGDMRRVAHMLRRLSTELDNLRLTAAERRLASARATLALRRAS